MTGKRALVLGGTGMLAGCAETLVADGWHVVLPSRRAMAGGVSSTCGDCKASSAGDGAG